MYPNVHCSTIYNSEDIETPRCPSTDEWIKKLWYIYTMEYYSAIKRNTFESVLMRWMNLEPIIQSEVGQKEKNKYHILTYIYIFIYIFIYMNSRWMVLMKLLRAAMETDIENRLMDKGGGKEGEGEMNRVVWKNIH